MKYIESMKIDGALRTPSMKQIPVENEIPRSKGKNREAVETQVFDLADSVADNAKMISMLMSIVMRMWDVMPQDERDDMDPADVTMINDTFALCRVTNTRADEQFAEEGFALIEKLLGRQAKIAEVVE